MPHRAQRGTRVRRVAGHLLVAGLVVLTTGVAGLVVEPAIADAGSPSLSDLPPGGGFHHVGRLPDGKAGSAGGADGALFLDRRHALGFVFEERADEVLWHAFDLDRFTAGGTDLESLGALKIEALVPPFPSSVMGGDSDRLLVETFGTEPIATLDGDRGRIMYVAENGSIYEVDYDEADPTKYRIVRWAAPPNPGAADDETFYFEKRTDTRVLDPQGIGYHGSQVDTEAGAGDPRIYLVGTISGGVGLEGWDASPTPEEASSPVIRRLWTYRTRTCQGTGRQGGRTPTAVFRAGEWLYTFCDGSADGSARGVLRVHLSTANSLAPGEMAPDGIEEFFPGVTGTEIETLGDSQSERMYVMSFNIQGGERSVLVFDGTAIEGQGAYIGAFNVSGDDAPAALGLNASSGRVYAQAGKAMLQQDGRLRRVAQPTSYGRDVEGAPLGADALGFKATRRLHVDGTGVLPRVFVQRPDGWSVYQDVTAPPTEPPPIFENTLNIPETDGTVGVYSTGATASGVRVRAVRGLSTAWPSSVPGANLESNPGNNPFTPQWYLTDPFFYHGGACGANDRELVFGRVLETKMQGGLSGKGGRARALAVDPDVHIPTAPDDTQTRDDVADPDPCARRFFERMTGPNCYEPGEDGEAAKRKESCEFEMPQDLGAFGREWPYHAAECLGEGTGTSESDASKTPIRGTASAACDALVTDASVRGEAEAEVLELGPEALVEVGKVETWTDLTRHPRADGEPGKGATAQASVRLSDIVIGQRLRIGEMLLTASAQAEGFATDQETTAEGSWNREFHGVSLDGASLCVEDCDEATVLNAVNQVIGPFGFARLNDPEPDITVGTQKGTLAVLQKNLVQQDADATMLRDFSQEWPGMTIVIYRHGAQRGIGAWQVTLGGVFAQTQFGVIQALGDLTPFEPPDVSGPDLDLPDLDAPQVAGETAEPQTRTVTVQSGQPASNDAKVAPAPERNPSLAERILQQVGEGLKFVLGKPLAALLLGALWTLVFAPVYVAHRRRVLRDLIETGGSPT